MNEPYYAKELVNSIIPFKERSNLLKKAKHLKSIVVSDRFLADCKMISIGAFTPLKGFMNKEGVDSVIKHLQLPNGLVWGVPIILLVSKDQASSIKLKDEVALLEKTRKIIAIIKITDKYKYNKNTFCKEIFKTNDENHPGVKMIKESPDVFLAGPVKLLNRPSRLGIDFSYYNDPIQTREEFKKRGWSTIVAFQTRNPIHRAHEYLIKCALEVVDGVLVHPLVGETKSDDIPAEVRMRCYEALIENYFNPKRIMLSALPTFMRYAGPREALNHAIIRKNYGCTHFIIGRDHAGFSNYYGSYEAQELLSLYANKIGIVPIKFENTFYCKKCKEMASSKTCPHTERNHLHFSGSQIRTMLKQGVRPPPEFSRKEVVDILIDWVKNHKQNKQYGNQIKK